jgi:DNA-binding CsgD family transcriptional regulator
VESTRLSKREDVTLLEREQAMELLTTCLDEAQQGSGRVVAVDGPAASGKSWLLHRFGDQAAAQGAKLLLARCSAADRHARLGVIAQLFHSAGLSGDGGAAVGQLISELGASSGCGSGGVDVLSAPVLQRLCAAVLEQAEGATLVIVVDDLRHADQASLQCVLELAHMARSERLLLVVSGSEGAGHLHPAFRTALLTQPYSRRVILNLLSRRAVAAILTDQLGGALADPLVESCYQASAGNPLLVRALVEDQRAARIGTREPEVRESKVREPEAANLAVGQVFHDAVLACIYRSSPLVFHTATALAVLGPATTPRLVERLLELTPESVAHAVQMLDDCGIVDGATFRHPAASAAVLGALYPADVTDLRRRAARLLYDEDADVTSIAANLVAAGYADEHWAVEVLLDAADHALADDNSQLAVESLRLAHSSSRDEGQRASILVRLIRTESHVASAGLGPYLSHATEALRSGQLSVPQAMKIVVHLLVGGRIEEGVTALRKLGRYADAPDATAADLAELRLSRLHLRTWFPGLASCLPQLPDDDTAARSTASMARRFDAADALLAVLTQRADEATMTRARRVVEMTGIEDASVDATVNALYALVYADQLDVATPWCDRFLEESRSRGHWYTCFASIRAEIAYRQGELRVAEDHALTALDRLGSRRGGLFAWALSAILLLTSTARGNYDEAARFLEPQLPDSALKSRFGLSYLYARGQFYVHTHRPHAAISDFLRCGELITTWGIDSPALVPWRVGLAQAHIGTGQPDQARTVLRDQLGLLGAAPSRARGIARRVLAGLSDTPERPRLLQLAADDLCDCGDRLELTRTLVDLCRAHRDLGDVPQASMLAQRARDLARRCHAESLCSDLPDGQVAGLPTRDRILGSVGAVSALSEAERRVTDLVIRGHTNREISKKLHITVSTVEQHLTRVYRKLHVSSRRDLSAYVGPAPSGLA